MKSFHKIVVLGGGPAGASTALKLANFGHDVFLVDSYSGNFKVGETVPPVAKPVLASLNLLDAIEDGSHIQVYGNQSAWGEDRLSDKDFIFDPNGSGWHLDRHAFDRTILERARQAGVVVVKREAARKCTLQKNGTWRIELGPRSGNHFVDCHWMIDATGRSRWAVRKLGVGIIRHDNLVALVGVFGGGSTAVDTDSRTLVESVANGWWYTAAIPGNRRIAAYFTDADDLSVKLAKTVSGFHSLMSETRFVRQRINDSAISMRKGPIARAANSSHLARLYGHGWLAVGDTARSFDPLSSQGILSALTSGELAAQAINDHLLGVSNALAEYERQVRLGFEIYLNQLRGYYQIEQRWNRHTFWRRRVMDQ